LGPYFSSLSRASSSKIPSIELLKDDNSESIVDSDEDNSRSLVDFGENPLCVDLWSDSFI
jgi:hypothetical protein